MLVFAISFAFYTGSNPRTDEPVSAGADSSQVDTFVQVGFASHYANRFHGQKTANGERYHKNRLTAAHRTLPFNTKVKVTNLKTGKWVIVRINDRGPYARKRIIDLSHRAAKHLGMLRGVLRVKVEVVAWPKEVLNGQ